MVAGVWHGLDSPFLPLMAIRLNRAQGVGQFIGKQFVRVVTTLMNDFLVGIFQVLFKITLGIVMRYSVPVVYLIIQGQIQESKQYFEAVLLVYTEVVVIKEADSVRVSITKCAVSLDALTP